MQKRSKNKDRIISIIQFVAIVIVFILLCLIIYRLVPKHKEIEKTININEYFNNHGDEVAILLNGDLQSAKAIDENDNVYLPLNWTKTLLNDRFYYANDINVLMYTLPDKIVSCNLETLGSDNKPLIIKKDDAIYLSINMIKAYTKVDFTFIDNDCKRLFINTVYGEKSKCIVKRATGLKVEADKKSPSLRKLLKDEELTILNDDILGIKNKKSKWKRVLTNDGFVGYVENKRIKNIWKYQEKSDFKEPKYTSLHLRDKVILGWLLNHTVLRDKDIEDNLNIIENARGINVVSPTWYSLLDNSGNIQSKANKKFVDKLHEKGILVWPLIDNFNKNVNSEKLFSNTMVRRQIIERLINDALAYKYDGLNIDFEGLKSEAIKHVLEFVRELSIECRKNKIILSIDIPNYQSYNDYYERDKFAKDVDYIINMGYDEHYSGSNKGSVASIAYVNEGITNTLKEVPAEKLINAMPLYTRIWSDKGSKAVGISEEMNWINDNNVDLNWKEDIGQYYGETVIDGKKYYIWVEDSSSIEKKIDLAKDANLAGVALWRLGMEDGDIWDTILRIKD